MKTALTLTTFLLLIPLSASAAFSDVSTRYQYHDAIAYVQSEGIVGGYNDGTFQPEQPINRVEFTKIVIGAIFEEGTIPGCTGDPFPDVKASTWFGPYVCGAVKAGLLSGYPDGTFKPGKTINFAEAAKIIANAYELETYNGEPWYLPYAQAITEESDLSMSFFRFTDSVNRGEMAHMIYALRHARPQRKVADPDPIVNEPKTEHHIASSTFSELKMRILELVNIERTKEGLIPMTYSTVLEGSAIAHVEDMRSQNYFSHDSLNGDSSEDRIRATGYMDISFDTCNCTSYKITVGENIAQGQQTAEEVMRTWMESPGHRENIMSPLFDEIGVGLSGDYWAQNFGRVYTE